MSLDFFNVEWSEEDGEYVATCPHWPSLSWLAPAPLEALIGLIDLILVELGASQIKFGLWTSPLD